MSWFGYCKTKPSRGLRDLLAAQAEPDRILAQPASLGHIVAVESSAGIEGAGVVQSKSVVKIGISEP